ncbi:hypothetical protein Taro_034200 [Colocasia esculenta]|uniref:Protein kinase domain-containing protein n=1 Tax=Colocasia esculenta TaxID=4460 RepID=A0A843VQM9_COLES|nr:hypothetical protein [Colocasia esculenta]
MELLRKKRKGGKWTSLSFLGSHLSYDDDVARGRKKFREEEPKACIEKECSRKHGRLHTGAVLTAPPCGGSSSFSDSPGRGLKRKLGCIESATRIGRKKKLEQEYVLGQEIGQGKFGSVRLCRSRATGEEFACKTLPKNGEETVHREVEIMQHLSGHPGVVTLNAVYEDLEYFHLVMELCSGGRLLDLMAREGRYSEQRAANLLRELILVIKYCHDMGVVHRDIKPENILLTTTGRIKLADFGLAVRYISPAAKPALPEKTVIDEKPLELVTTTERKSLSRCSVPSSATEKTPAKGWREALPRRPAEKASSPTFYLLSASLTDSSPQCGPPAASHHHSDAWVWDWPVLLQRSQQAPSSNDGSSGLLPSNSAQWPKPLGKPSPCPGSNPGPSLPPPPLVFTPLRRRDEIVSLIVYVDDMLLTGGDIDGTEEVMKYLQSHFIAKNLGKLKHFLGLGVAYGKERQ